MGGFRDNHEALRARIAVLERELAQGRHDAAREAVSELATEVKDAVDRTQRSEADLASLVVRLESLERTLGGGARPPSPALSPRVAAFAGAGVLAVLAVVGVVGVTLGGTDVAVVVAPAPVARPPVELPPPPLPTEPAAPVEASPEGLDAAQVREVFTRERRAVQRCWQQLVVRAPGVTDARVQVDVVIDASGAVTSVAARGDDHRELLSCIEDEVRRLRFSPSAAPTTVSIPFVFQSGL